MSNCDALSEQFFKAFNVSKPKENDTIRPHPKYFRFTNTTDSPQISEVGRIQNARRKEFFERIAKRREKILLKLRPLEELVEDNEKFNYSNESISSFSTENSMIEEVSEHKKEQESMSIENQGNVSSFCKKRKFSSITENKASKSKVFQAQQLMLSEWLIDVPEDLYTNWFMLCCPVGKRALVISGNGRTKVFSRSGNLLFQMSWSLNDFTIHRNKRSRPIILDCFYVEGERTFYILDVLAWNGHNVSNCDTQFRFYWLRTKYAEDLKIMFDQQPASNKMEVDGSNIEATASKTPQRRRHRFVPLNYCDCTPENIQKQIKGPRPFSSEIDGVLFYHKDAPYIPGVNPVVLWLKTFMIQDILKIDLG